MIDERDLTSEKNLFNEIRAKTVATNLEKNNINAKYVSSSKEALSIILDMIPRGATVAHGDSVSLHQIEVIDALEKRGENILIPFAWARDTDGRNFLIAESKERKRLEREVFSVDVYLTSTNAVTLDGKLVNIDGHGNRASAMFFGPKKVIVAAGVNKIVKDVNEALERIRQIAAPLTALRHHLKHKDSKLGDLPCVKAGRCVDCRHDWRICCYTVIIEYVRLQEKGRINVVLIGEDLGI